MREEATVDTRTTGHILVVDDYALNRLKLARLLEQQGHTVAMAEDGQQALAMLRSQPFDVVLLDIVMPEMDGYQVLEHLQGDTTLREIPVIVISAVDEVESVVKCIELGALDYLPKPFNPTLLRARLATSLQKKKLRDLERSYLQQEIMLRQTEKLATLGRLSAGMAHELNNPVAAVRSSAGHLHAAFARLQQVHQGLGKIDLTGAQFDVLAALDQQVRTRAKQTASLSALARQAHETSLETWLDAQGVADAWEISPQLAALDYTVADLVTVTAGFSPAQGSAVMTWLGTLAAVYTLLGEIDTGTSRIVTIVGALKAYTFLDQAPVQNVDVHEGLENTLVMLHAKLAAGVTVRRDYGTNLPRIEAYGSELNQVWTHLIDNAIDATGGLGEIILRTSAEGSWLVVEITDSGPGIPPAVQPHIFDPFFTTKPPGAGTGLGLNICHQIIVDKHRGQITVSSHPGQTTFEIRLPQSLTPNP